MKTSPGATHVTFKCRGCHHVYQFGFMLDREKLHWNNAGDDGLNYWESNCPVCDVRNAARAKPSRKKRDGWSYQLFRWLTGEEY